jgi:quinolinate synthase
MELKEKIEKLKKEKNAIILAHVYQRGEVQNIADFTGDSLELSRKAVNTKADVIVFCGVKFMAETTAILNPNKIVLLPENAGCPLADMATTEQLRIKKKEHPDAKVVSYVNSSAAIKSESDICCTSANAIDIVKSLKGKILFLPDKNLGHYVASKIDKKIILWNGFCYVHEKNIKPEKIKELRRKYSDAKIMVHPECNLDVISLADFVGSTSQMLKYAKNSKAREFIVGTEEGLIYRLQKENPNKKFYSSNAICKDMKLINLESILLALKEMKYQVSIPKNIQTKAKKALDKMLKIK